MKIELQMVAQKAMVIQKMDVINLMLIIGFVFVGGCSLTARLAIDVYESLIGIDSIEYWCSCWFVYLAYRLGDIMLDTRSNSVIY